MSKYYFAFTGRLPDDGEDTVYVTQAKMTELEAETAFREYMASTYGGSSVPVGTDPVAWVAERVEIMYTLRSDTPILLVLP
jgi:hypothetical protein